jgi:hypothetical protein
MSPYRAAPQQRVRWVELGEIVLDRDFPGEYETFDLAADAWKPTFNLGHVFGSMWYVAYGSPGIMQLDKILRTLCRTDGRVFCLMRKADWIGFYDNHWTCTSRGGEADFSIIRGPLEKD